MQQIESRLNILRRVEEARNSKVILYVTGDRQGLNTQIGQDVIDLFIDHLDALGPVDKISLIIYTIGGNTSAAWNLINLLQMFCEELEVIVPGKCMSAGTLISLGADRIVMTKQATLGPIDPSLQHPLGPQIPGASPEARANVSVEAVFGYLDELNFRGLDDNLKDKILLELSNKVHPLVLGEIFRTRRQIRDLANKLLVKHIGDKGKINGIIDFLCSDSGSHDYTINRREASELGLNIEKCTEELYDILRELHTSYSDQMELQKPYDFNEFIRLAEVGRNARYNFTRAIIESHKFGAHHFVTEGEVVAEVNSNETGLPNPQQLAIRDKRNFEGWRKMV